MKQRIINSKPNLRGLHRLRGGVFALLACVIAQMALTTEAQAQGEAGKQHGEVVVTIKPLHALVQAVLGDTQTAQLLVEGNNSPHGFALKPSQVRAIQRADVVFYIDPGFEGFMNKSLRSVPASVQRFPVVKNAQLDVLKVREGGAWEGHAHHHHGEEHGHDDHHDAHDKSEYKDEHKDHDHDHDHDKHAHDKHHEKHDDHDDNEDKHDDHERDLHVWLSPDNAKRIVHAVEKELARVYPARKTQFATNAQAQIQRIDLADADLKKQLVRVQGKPYIVFHDAYQYFEKHYGLNAVGSITLEPEESPSVRRVKEIRKKIKNKNVQCVFSEPQFSDKLINTVIDGKTVRTARLDPLGAGVASSNTAYTDILRNLGKEITGCLK